MEHATDQPTSPSPVARRLDAFDGCLLLLVVLCFLLQSLMPFAPKRFGDMEYHPPAKALAAALRGAGPWSDVRITEFPAPVLYYALAYLAVPPGASERVYWVAALLWSALWVSVSVLLVRRAAEAIAGSLAGKLAAVFLVVPPLVVYYSFGVSAEVPAFLGATLLIYGWTRGAGFPKYTTLRTPGVPAALAGSAFLILSRPNAALVAPIALAAAVWLRGRARRSGLARIGALCGATMIVVAVGAAAIAGRAGRSGAATPQAGELAHVVFHGRFQFRWEPWDWRFWGRETRRGSRDYAAWRSELGRLERASEQRGVPLSTLEWQWVLRDLRAHPILAIRSALVRMLALQVALVNSKPPAAFRVGRIPGTVVYTLFHVALNALSALALCLAAWWLVRKPARLAVCWPLWSPWAALTLFHAATYAEPRYLLPGKPGIAALAGVALTELLTRARRPSARSSPGPEL